MNKLITAAAIALFATSAQADPYLFANDDAIREYDSYFEITASIAEYNINQYKLGRLDPTACKRFPLLIKEMNNAWDALDDHQKVQWEQITKADDALALEVRRNSIFAFRKICNLK